MGDVVGAWSTRRVLVTGAAGFLGSWTCAQLARSGATVLGIDIAWDRAVLPVLCEPVTLDCRDGAGVALLLREHRIDTVLHLAAQSIVGEAQNDPAAAFANNVEGTWSVLEACRSVGGVAIVVASSDKAYGDAKGEVYDETMPLLARNPYDVSKACADMIASSYFASYGMPVAITRCGNLYGGGDVHYSRIVPGTIQALLTGERIIIRSDGSFVRDYLYVEDAALGVLTLAAALPFRSELHGEAFNFAAGARHSVLEIVEKIAALIGVDANPDVRNIAAGEIREQRLSAAKASTLLGWSPQTSVDDGLQAAIGWYREHLNA